MSTAERVLVFAFDPDAPALPMTVRQILGEGREPIVIALGLHSLRRVEQLPAGVVIRHISDPRYCRGDHRATAASWVHHCFTTARLAASGRTLLETSYAGTPIWWFTHLHLQEKAFALVRLIESVSRAVTSEGASAFALIESDPRRESWQPLVVRRLCERRGLKEIAAGDEAPRAQGAPAAVQAWRRPRQPGVGPIQLDEVRPPLTPATVTRRLASRTLRGLWRLARFMASPVALLYSVVWLRGRPSGVAFSFGQPASRIFGSMRSVLGKIGRSRPVIMCVVDVGGLKRRLDLRRGRLREYDPYFEGVVERLQSAGRARGFEVLALEYGMRGAGPTSRIERAVIELRKLLRRDTLSVLELIPPEAWVEAERWRGVGQEIWEALREDVELQSTVAYQGVPVWEVLAPDIEVALRYLGHAVLYVHAVRAFKGDRGDQRLLVLYAFEGSFRPICAGAVAEGVPTVGAQFTLGPNVLGLDQSVVGYRWRGGGVPLGCPIPERIAAWSPFYRDLFHGRYGYPDDSVDVVGYPRLDTFVRERPELSREVVLRRLGLQGVGGRGVMFTGVLRAGGAAITLEDEYVETFRALVRISERHPDVFVLVKPWSGDDLTRIKELCLTHGNSRTVYVAPRLEVHNVDLFRLSDVMIGTLSSIFAEALIMENACVLMDYSSCRAHFGDEHTELFRPLATVVRETAEVESAVEAALARPSRRLADQPAVREGLERIFGPVDGDSVGRLVELILARAASMSAPLGVGSAGERGRVVAESRDRRASS